MRSFSSILRPDRFGDFYRTTSRYPSLSSIQSFSYASFHLKKKNLLFVFHRLDWQSEDRENFVEIFNFLKLPIIYEMLVLKNKTLILNVST